MGRLLGGIILVFLRWLITGVLIEMFGFSKNSGVWPLRVAYIALDDLILQYLQFFRDYFPAIITFLRQLLFIGRLECETGAAAARAKLRQAAPRRAERRADFDTSSLVALVSVGVARPCVMSHTSTFDRVLRPQENPRGNAPTSRKPIPTPHHPLLYEQTLALPSCLVLTLLSPRCNKPPTTQMK